MVHVFIHHARAANLVARSIKKIINRSTYLTCTTIRIEKAVPSENLTSAFIRKGKIGTKNLETLDFCAI